MKNTIRLNESNIEIPMIGFGPDTMDYVLGPRSRKTIFHRAYNKFRRTCIEQPKYINAVASSFKIGYRLLDWSAAYGSGTLLVKAIKKSGVNRNEIIITTRVSNKAQFENTVEKEFINQLKTFDTDYIDILMFHWPVTNYYTSTWLKMIELKKKGLCKVLGVANCNIHHLQKLYEISGVYPEIDQVEVHPLFNQMELREFCKQHSIQIESYSPTARHDDRLYNPRLLKELSLKYDCSINQLILRWHVQNGLIPIIRSWNPKHQKNDFDIFDFEIEEEDMKKIDALNINSRIRYDPDNCDFHSL